jgi:hypothetical protein
MSTPTPSRVDHPKTTVEAMQRLVAAELSLPSRLGYTALLLAAGTVTAVVAALWLTEPALPFRARLGFAGIIAIGSCWMVFAIWVLTRRRVLLGRDRTIAAGMSVTFCALFAIGFAALGYWGGVGRIAYTAAGSGLVMLAIALALLARARRHVAGLLARRLELEREIARTHKGVLN